MRLFWSQWAGPRLQPQATWVAILHNIRYRCQLIAFSTSVKADQSDSGVPKDGNSVFPVRRVLTVRAKDTKDVDTTSPIRRVSTAPEEDAKDGESAALVRRISMVPEGDVKVWEKAPGTRKFVLKKGRRVFDQIRLPSKSEHSEDNGSTSPSFKAASPGVMKAPTLGFKIGDTTGKGIPKSKVSVDNLLDSILKSSLLLGSRTSTGSAALGIGNSYTNKRAQLQGHALSMKSAVNTRDIYYEDDLAESDAKVTAQARHKSSKATEKSMKGFHILVLENCGITMLESDIRRIFSNHEASVEGWRVEGTDIAQIVPARNTRFQRIARYYLYFRTLAAAKHHLQHSIIARKPKKEISWELITLPPAAASTLPSPDQEYTDNGSSGGPTDVQPWVPILKLVEYSRNPSHGAMPNALLASEGAPGRTVFLCMSTNSHWLYLQVWLRYELIEKYGFGRWLVSGGDSEGYGLERVPLYNESAYDQSHVGGGWLVRFRKGHESEAERLVRDWDGKWVNVRGEWGRMKAELQW